MDLQKAFDCVPRKFIWWALRKLGVEEWIVRLVQRMNANAPSQVRVGESFSQEFEVKVRVHQGSVLSPLLFIIVLEALSAIILTNLVEAHVVVLHTKYQCFSTCDFRQEDFFHVFPM